MTLSTFFLLIVVIIGFLFQKFTRQDWCSPSSIYMYWSLSLILGGVFLAYTSYQWKVTGLLWWIFSCFLYSFGSSLFANKKSKLIKISLPNFIKKISCIKLLWFYFSLGVVYSVLMLHNNGFSITSIFNLSTLFEINTYMMAHRYGDEDLHESIVQQICLSFTYGLPISVGYLLAYEKLEKIKYLCMLCFIPNILVTALNNTKCGTIFAVMLFFIGYLLGYISKENKMLTISKKIIIYGIGGFAIFISIMVLSLLLRHNSDTSKGTIEALSQTLIDYIFGGTLNFDYYFDVISDNKIEHDYLEGSNIITANAYWIGVYGYVGTLIIWFIKGCFSGLLYNRLKNGIIRPFEQALLAYFYLNALYFFIWVPFMYTTVTIGVFFLFPFFIVKHNYELK